MAGDAQRLQVAVVVRPAKGQLYDVVDLLSLADDAFRLAVAAERFGAQDAFATFDTSTTAQSLDHAAPHIRQRRPRRIALLQRQLL
jgi:hypothetical protein